MLFTTIAVAQPKSVQLQFKVTRNGQPFANIKEHFTQNGQQYKIESVTKGLGVYALFGERKMISTGVISSNGLIPKHFELHQGNSAKKTLITDFDWANSTLNMQVKGNIKTAVLQKGTQDLLSYAYQLMYAPPQNNTLNNTFNIRLTTGKKLRQHTYKVAKNTAMLEIANSQFETLHLTTAPAIPTDENIQMWLAKIAYENTHVYLPVRIDLQEDGAQLQQTLTKIHVE